MNELKCFRELSNPDNLLVKKLVINKFFIKIVFIWLNYLVLGLWQLIELLLIQVQMLILIFIQLLSLILFLTGLGIFLLFFLVIVILGFAPSHNIFDLFICRLLFLLILFSHPIVDNYYITYTITYINIFAKIIKQFEQPMALIPFPGDLPPI